MFLPAAKAWYDQHRDPIRLVLGTGREWQQPAAEAVRPLLEDQHYIQSVCVDFSGPPVYYGQPGVNANFKDYYPDVDICIDEFRWKTGIGMHLSKSMAAYLGVEIDLHEACLDVPRRTSTKWDICLHAHQEPETGKSIQHPSRYHHLLEGFDVVVIGTENDIHDLDPLECKSVEYIPTRDFLHAAEIVCQSSVLVAGDHAPLHLGFATWTPTIAEVFSPLRNTIPLLPDTMWMDMQFSSIKDMRAFNESCTYNRTKRPEAH